MTQANTHGTRIGIWFHLNQSVLSPLSKSPFSLKKESALSPKEMVGTFLFLSGYKLWEWKPEAIWECVFPCMEKILPGAEAKWQKQKQNDNTQKMLRREMRGLGTQVSCHQSHLSTCHFHNLCQRNSWRVIKTVKTDSIQDYCKRGKKPQYRAGLVLKTTWKGGNL